MNKYFLSQIIYDRFKLYDDFPAIIKTMENLRSEIKNNETSQRGLERVLQKHVNKPLCLDFSSYCSKNEQVQND
jgi:hypothetical protein